jgi:hypothetical protein
MSITQVHAVNPNNKPDNTDVIKSVSKPKEVVTPTKTTKKADTAIVSEKAKDLAALKSGTQFAEEAKESIIAKNKEALQNSIT